MSNAYATLANGGVHHTATAISQGRVPRTATIDVPEDAEGNRVLTDGVAYEVDRRARRACSTRGTGTAARHRLPGRPARPGRPTSYTDAWFVGYTPQRSRPRSGSATPTTRTSMGSSAFGGTYAAPIWNDYMSVRRHRLRRLPVPRTRPTSRASTATAPRVLRASTRPRHRHATPTTPATTDRPPATTTDPDLYAPGDRPGAAPTPAPTTTADAPRTAATRADAS